MRKTLLILFILFTPGVAVLCQTRALVFQSDFGLKDGAVGAMKGVAFSVSPDLRIFDITHEIPAYNIWEAAYRLQQAAPYWPPGTVFVSIVDPGVGSQRKSVVLKTKSGHFVVTPDNGTLTLIAESLGIEEMREIDEAKNRLNNSEQSYTFHGRDVYAYTGARLATGVITFEGVGPVASGDVVRLAYQKATIVNGIIKGNIPVLDVQYGNVWTNIDKAMFDKLDVKTGDIVKVKVLHHDKVVYEGKMPYARTFSDVPEGKALAYLNSLLNFSMGVNMGSFAEKFKVGSGAEWGVVVSK